MGARRFDLNITPAAAYRIYAALNLQFDERLGCRAWGQRLWEKQYVESYVKRFGENRLLLDKAMKMSCFLRLDPLADPFSC